MYNIIINNRNRLSQNHQFRLPLKSDRPNQRTIGRRANIDFLKLSEKQIAHMREHRTTELPPAMFQEAVFGTKQGEKDEIKKIVFTAFTLTTSFDQNIALMRDGSVVFCHRFIHRDFDVDGENDEPLIAGFKFKKVSMVSSRFCYYHLPIIIYRSLISLKFYILMILSIYFLL